jgi:hypothetical protein
MARFPGRPPVLIRKVPATAARTAADSVFVGSVFVRTQVTRKIRIVDKYCRTVAVPESE